MNKPLVRILVIFVAVLLGSGLLVYILLERDGRPGRSAIADAPSTTEGQSNTGTGSQEAVTKTPDKSNRSVLT
ncbi:MAG: hypothetical protein ACREA9_00125, partial [Pyrinomonadaceae bacterium]